MKKKFNFSKRIIAALLTLAMLLSAASSLLVFGVSAEESEETKGQMTDGKVVANNYDLTEAEKKLLSSGFLVGDTYGYEVPGTSDDLISVNTDDKTVTAKSFEGTKGFVWNPVYAEVVVNNVVVETIKFSDNKASYTTDAAAFSVKVKYTVEREIDADLQELLLNAPADLKNDVEMLDKLLDPNGEAMSAIEQFVYYATQNLPENADNPNASKKGALELLVEDGYAYSIKIANRPTKVSMQFSSDMLSKNEGIKYNEVEAANKLLAQLDANDGKLNLTVISDEYAAASSKVEYLVNNLDRIQKELLDTYDCLYALTGDDGTLNGAAYMISAFFGDSGLCDTLNIFISSITAISGDKTYTNAGNLVVLEEGALDAYVADGAWKTEGKTLVRDDLTTAEYMALDILVENLDSKLKGPSTAVRNPLILDATTIQFNMAMYDVTVNVILETVENKVGSAALKEYAKATVKLTLPQKATKAEILSAIEASMVEQNALTAWADVYVAEHFARNISELPESLTENVSFNIIYTPNSYEINADYEEATMTVPYGYQYKLPLHADGAMAYDYWVNGNYREQGTVIVIGGDTVVTRKEGKAYTTYTVNSIVAENFFADSNKATAILTSGALNAELGNSKVNVREPEATDNLVTLDGKTLTAANYASGYEGFYWMPYTYTVVSGTDSKVYFFNGANEVKINDSFDRVDVIYALTLTNLSDVESLVAIPATLVNEAADQKDALNKLNNYYDQMGDINKGMLNALKSLINDSSADAESKENLMNALGSIVSNCVDSDNSLKLYNLMTNYRSQGLSYYYKNSDAFISQIDAMSEHLGVIVEEEELLKEIAGSMGDYTSYIDKIGKLEGAMAELKADLKAPNAVININSSNLNKLINALEMSGEIPAVTVDTMQLTSSAITMDAPDKVTLSIKVAGVVVTKTFDAGYVLMPEDIEAIIAEANKVLVDANGNEKYPEAYYEASYDLSELNAWVKKNVDDLAEALEKDPVVVTYTAKKFAVKIEGADDAIVDVNDLTVELPESEEDNIRYDYYINGVKISGSVYKFESIDDVIGGNAVIIRVEVDIAEEKYLDLVTELNSASNGEIEFALVKNADGYAIVMKMTSFDPSEMASSMQGLAAAFINYSYVGFDDNAFIYDDGNGTKVSLQALIGTILSSGFGSGKLIEMINADGTVNTVAMPGEFVAGVNMDNAGAVLAETSLRLGEDDENGIKMYITMSSAPSYMVELRNLFAEELKNYFGFTFENGKAVLSLNMPQKAYEAYLALLLATDNVDITDINSINEDVAIGFLENFVRPLLLDDEVTAETASNTLKKFGINVNFAKYENAYERIRHFYKSTNFEYDTVESTYGSKIVIDIEKYLDKADLGQFGGMIAEKNGGVEIYIGATIVNLDKEYEALYFDIAAKGITKKFGLVTDIAAKLEEMQGTAVVLLTSNVEADLIFKTTTILNLNGFTVDGDIVAENGSVRIVDSAIDEGCCGEVTGTISGNVRLAGGKYSYDVSKFIPEGYEQKANGVVSNKFMTIVRDENGNINVKLDAGTLYTENLPDIKTLAVDILVEILLNGYTANSLYVDGNKLYSLTVDEIIGLYAASDRKDALIKRAMKLVDGQALVNILNLLLEDMTDFKALSDTLNADIANGTETPLFSYDLTVGTWGISFDRVEDGNYIDVSITDGEPKDCTLNIMLSGTATEKQPIADVLQLAADIVTVDELSLEYSLSEKYSTILFYAGLNLDVKFDLAKRPEYVIMLSVIAANGVTDAAKKEALVAGMKSYFDGNNMTELAKAFNDLTLADLVTAAESYARTDSLTKMMGELELGEYTDSVSAVDGKMVAFAKLIAVVARRIDATGPSYALKNFADADYSYTLDRENIDKTFECGLPAGYGAALTFELIDAYVSLKVFDTETTPDLPDIEEINYDELITLINDIEAEGLNENDYTASSWAAFADALARAKSLIGNAKTQAQVDNAYADLSAAREALTPRAPLDYSELQDEIDDIRNNTSFIASDYTDDSWDAFINALANAEKLINNATEQTQIDEALEALKAARSGLTPKERNYEALKNLIDNIESELNTLIESDFTEGSWKALLAELDAAKALIDNAELQSIVDRKYNDLANARAGLTLESVDDLRDNLSDKVDEIKNDNLIEGDYTAESWKNFQEALNKATELLGKLPVASIFKMAAKIDFDTFENAIKRSDVQAALDELNEAYAALINISELKNLIDDVENLNSSDYTANSWATFEEELNKAKDMLVNAESQKDVDDAVTKLKEAHDALVYISSLKALVAEIEREQLAEGNYSLVTWNNFIEALNNANNVASNAAATKEDVVTAEDALSAARNALVDVSELKFLIESASNLDENKYNADSWASFESVLAEAIALLETAEDKNAVKSMVAKLAKAIEALVEEPIPEELDYTKLQTLIDGFSSIDSTKYSTVTWNNFAKALSEANGLINNAESQKEIDDAYNALIDVYNKLVDIRELKALIADKEALDLDEDNYTANSWATFEKELNNAKDMLINATSVEKVENAINTLNAAEEALINIKSLKDLIATIEAEQLAKENYSFVTWNNFIEALNNANNVASNAAATEKEVTGAEDALSAARNALVDISSLKALIADKEALNLDEDHYTANSWKAYSDALANAKDMLINATSATDVEDAISALNAAEAALVNIKSLKDLIATIETENLDENLYTADTWSALQDALNNAKALLNNAKTQAEVDAMLVALKAARLALTLKPTDPETPEIDYSALITEIEKIKSENLDEALYTADTWSALQEALNNANALLNNAKTQAEVDAMLVALKAARLALTLKPTDPETPVIDYTALAAEIAKIEVENLDATLYTTETWVALQTALNNAKALLNNAETQAEVDEMLETLKAARAALTLKPIDPEQPVIDYSALENEIAKIEAEGLKEEDYTAESWSAFKTAMDSAKALIGKATEQSAVDNALNALKAAYEGLEKKPTSNPDDPGNKPGPDTPKADYTALTEAIAKAKELKEEDYTSASWLALQKALVNAEKALESNDQAVVDEATAALNSAIEALEMKKQSSLAWLWILLIILAIIVTAGVIILIIMLKKKKETEDSTPLVDYNIGDDDASDADAADAADAEAVDAEAETEADAEETVADEAEAEEAEAEEAEAEEAEAEEAEAEEAEVEEAEAEEAEAEEAEAEEAEAEDAEPEADDAEEESND